MTYAVSKTIEIEKIPVIDVKPLRAGTLENAYSVALEIRQAAEEIGFFYIRNHGVPESVIKQSYSAAKDFFNLPKVVKNNVKINSNHHGYLCFGEAKMEQAKSVDLKESFVWGLDLPDEHPSVTMENPFLGRNQWPVEIPEFKKSVYPFFEAGLQCGLDMMRAFALGMGLPEDSFLKATDEPIARSSIIHYPPQSEDLGEEQFGVAPHTDYGCLTLLWQDQVGGLEVQNREGEWVTAHPIDNTLVVNVGDLLMRWTNEGFISTPHRVVNRKGQERYSMVIAWDPNFDTIVDPSIVCQNGALPLYSPLSCGDYVLSRFDSSFSYRQ
ncbi:MAG: isopenicillin N synthase family oxygenase [Proteobacteria bacterium]|nr:MAG: isopenicillin N synthase family oxygenase [Pseudomonadota bacterium]